MFDFIDFAEGIGLEVLLFDPIFQKAVIIKLNKTPEIIDVDRLGHWLDHYIELTGALCEESIVASIERSVVLA